MRGTGNRGSERGRKAIRACAASSALLVAVCMTGVLHAAGIGGSGPPPGQTVPGRAGGTDRSGTPSRTAPGTIGGSAAPAAPAVMTPPVQVLPAPKKPIQINPAILHALYPALLKTDTKAERMELEAALKDATSKEHSVYLALWYYQHHVNQCAQKQYTVEEQKQAGCLGTDTLDQCSSKLFNHCVGSNKSFPNKFHAERKSMLEASDRLDKAMKAYTVKLKMIP